MSVNKANVFSSKNLSACMLSSLPKDASPHLRDPYDAVALLSHACMIAVGFRLEGLGEDHRIGTIHHSPRHHYSAILTPSPEPPSDPNNPSPLPPEWNNTTTSNYAFRYAHDQSSLHYILKTSRLGSKAIIHALAINDDKVHSLDVPIKDFFSQSSFPFTATASSSSSTSTEENNDNQDNSFETQENENKLSSCFISPARMTDLAASIKLSIIQKLARNLQKEGYEESAHAASTAADEERRPNEQQPPERGDRSNPRRPAGYEPLRDDPLPPAAQPRPFHDPLAAEPRRPYPAGDFPPPGFEDEYEMNRPPGPRGGIGANEPRRPLNIGERDLYPPGMAPHDPLRAGGPGFGGIGGGGMHPTFDDPLFGGQRGGGGNGRAPPGARYDPVGPGDAPQDLRGGMRFPGGGGGRGGPPNPFGGFGGGDFI